MNVPAAVVAAMVFTVLLLVVTAYFLLGSVPLLILRHDDPMDARFVRGFFDVYYRATMLTASGTAVSFGFAGRGLLAAGAVSLVLVAWILRRRMIPAMASAGGRIEASGGEAVRRFRRLHLAAIAVNLVQLVFIVWALVRLSVV